MKSLNIISILCIIIFASCVNEPTENNITIKTGSSFGFCVGYCSLEATITESKIEYVSSSWDKKKYPEKTQRTSMNPTQWNEILNNLAIDQFEKLDEVIGCPDCADGGSEWIEIITPEISKKVTFEYGDSLEGMRELLKILRGIRNKYNELNSSDNINYGIHYSNSFESISDTTGWEGITEEMLKPEPAPNFGLKSLHIGGGCIQPAASFRLKYLPTDSYYISFWAKIEVTNQSGAITLTNGSNQEVLSATIDQKEWRRFELGPVAITSDQSLRIEILVGGIIPVYMFIDNLEVYTIN